MAITTVVADKVAPRGGPAGTSVVVTGSGFGVVAGHIIYDPLGANGGPYIIDASLWRDDRIEYTSPLGYSLPDRDNRFFLVQIEKDGASDGTTYPWWVPDSALTLVPPPSSRDLDYQWPAFEASQDTDDPRKAQAADFNRHLDRTLALEAGGGGAGGGGGWIMIRDITPTGGGVVGSKTYQTPENDVLQTAVTDTLNLDVLVNATGPRVKVNGIGANLTKIVGESYYAGVVPIAIAGTGSVVATQVLPDDTDGAIDTCAVTLQAGPVVLTCVFTGGYPGVQTELKAGDTFQIAGTTDTPADLIEIQDFGACDFASIAIAEGTSFSITGIIADRGTTVQDLAARVRARNSALAFGAAFDTDTTGAVDGVNTVKCNNVFPSFVDNGTTFPGIQTAFKGVDAGSQDTLVSNFDTVLYSSPHGDFSIASSTTYVQDKPIVCTSPGDYNDSATNFRIVATRVANAAVATFDKTIEVADIAPVVMVTQPAARLRSGGNDSTVAQNHLITATSNQNLTGAPDITVPVAGTWQGGGFVGGPKVWTRTIQIHDNDAKGIAAWAFVTPPTNNAGTAATIVGNQVNGGFVPRNVTFAAFSQTALIGAEVVTYTKLTAGIFTATNQPSNRNPVQGDVSNLADTYTVVALAVNPTTVFWNDAAAAASNSSGTAQLLALEELV